jgi:sterol desaturase/sphingolipid hydroxylase (fatty acid hydroxylase superfamily)
MKMSKLGYFAEFLIFPPLVLLATLFAFGSPVPPGPLVWLAVYAAGLVGWTLIEYVLHRVLFHHAPMDLIGTPAWASLVLGVIAVASPLWAALGFDLGTAATAGLVTGYLWYVVVHYGSHHWRPRPGSYFYRARMRHARHHHLADGGNFGVTTGVWDHVFGTALSARPRKSCDAFDVPGVNP